MRSIVRGVVALVVALFMCRAVEAVPTIVSPADYSAFSTYSLAFKEILEEGSLGPDAYVSSTWSNPYFSYTDYSSGATAATSKRVADRLLMRDNALPVTLKWAGSAGQVVVKLWRTKKDSANNPQFTVTTTGTSAKFYDLEFGRNYTWTVTDSTGTATGHFYITNDSGAPRILLYDHDPDASGADTSNTRDMGGWRTTNGKVVKQGLIYRTAELEWCNPTDANGMRQELTYLKNTLGIKFDMDFRDHADLTSVNELAYAGEASVVKRGWKWAWKNGSYLTINESNIGEGVYRLNVNKLTGVAFGSYTGLVPKKSATATENKNNRKNVWCAFTNLANSANWPMVFHCSHGKDRAGTFALVIQGVLGVPKEAALKDYAISWFDSPDKELDPSSISNTCANLATYVSGSNLSTTYFKDQCINFLVQCGKDAGLSETDAKSKITAFQNAMLEDPEMPDLNPNLTSEPETDGDTFTYENLYHRRHAGGGGVASDNGSTLSYMYTTETGESTHPAISKFNNYDVCLYFYPTAGLPYSTPVGNYYKVGKVVSNGYYSPSAVGPYSFKFYFSSADHSKSDRTIIEHRVGVGKYENVDLYFTKYDSSNLGEGGRNLAYAYTGDSAAIEIWANATMRIMDVRDMSQLRSAKGYKAYIKFPKGRCANARLEALETDRGDRCSLGWFTGGEAGTRQYMKVSNTLLEFNAPNKTSTVEGALGLEFSLGSVNTTSSQAMLKVADKLVIPTGSTLTVNAGRKGAGTYKLIQAGTLTDNANLTLRANYKVDNCKIGYYGTIVNEGNNINLVIQEGTAPDDESFIDTETEGDWGYRLKIGNEVVLAFTNHTKSVNWKVPANIVNARFLIVGGGGGGGADNADGAAFGGAGGGGGGVVTGNISLNADDFVSIFVGAGGAGGTVEEDKSTSITTEKCYGASAKGKESKITVNNIDYVKAFGGGQDQGVSSPYTSGETTVSGTPHVGGLGGSNAGSRGGYASEQAAINLDNVGYVANFEALSNCQRYGNIGGMGSQEIYYGHPAAGGGGGATEPGGNAGNKAAGWPAGKGGEGLASDITGTMLVYGSGGGGASGQGSLGGVGGTGAGDGGDSADSQGTSAVANQGGGGGGSSRETTRGGNGGSGIVVIRYVEEAGSPDDPDAPAVKIASEPAVIPNLVYNGNEQNGVIAGEGYVLSGVTKATFAGTYEAVATLKSGYTWSDGATEAKTLTWSIAQFSNSWTVEPSISLDSWISGSAVGELIVGVARFGGAPTGVFVKGGEGEFTTMPTAPGEYEVKFTIPETSDWTGLTKTVAFTILEPGEINPTEYGAADTAASTYTWRGYTGPWMYTTNWTATASGTYGVPNNGTYATADFPAALENAFTCTLNQSVSVKYAKLDAPNMNLVLDNATLTITDRANPSRYVAYEFGAGDNASASIEFRGASSGIVNSKSPGLARFGFEESATDKVRCTVRFIVPATGWENTAPIRATGNDSSINFYYDSKLVIDATRLGVPGADESKKVLLAEATNRLTLLGDVVISCAQGAKGSVEVVNKQLVLTVVADPNYQPEEPEPEVPELNWGEIPSLSKNIFKAGETITVFNGTCENGAVAANYSADDIAALEPGTYTFRSTASREGAEPLVYEIDFWVLPADFSVANTIVCYGDSITHGAGAAEITADARSNYFDGRMAGQKIWGNYPYYLAGMIDTKYNVVGQGTPQQWSDTILAWLGGIETVSRLPVTLPAGGGDVWAPTNIIFTADNPYGVEGGLHYVRTIQYPPYDNNGDRISNHPLNYFAGMATPMYPAFEAYPSPSGINGSLTGWFGNKRVRIHGVTDANREFSGDNVNGVYCTDHRWQRVSTEGNVTTIPANTPFIPDTAIILKDAISVIYTGTNDEMGKDRYNENRDPDIDHNTYIKMIADTIAKNPSGRYVVVSTLSLDERSDESEAAFAKEFGENYLNLHEMMERYGVLVANKLGIEGVETWNALDGTGFLNSDATHPNEKGYQVIAYFINQKLIDLKYIEGERDEDVSFDGENTEEPEEPVLVAVDAPVAATGLVYTGLELTGVVAANDGYVLSGDLKAVDAGTYTATATLAEGYKWSDGTTEPKTITWSIAKATNAWTTEPSISLDSWTEGETAGVLTAGVAKFGEVVVTIDGAAFEMPTAPGAYTVKYAVVGTDNYNGLEMSVSFEILEAVVVPDPDEPGDEPQEPESNIPVIDSKWGYVKTGLGALGNEVAVVFTNHTEEATWTVPEDIENVQFLVVGGGGGGGGAVADNSGKRYGAAGAGGGAGCVVTGFVNRIASKSVVRVQVGSGGEGGKYKSGTPVKGQGASENGNGNPSIFAVDNVVYVTAYGGGGDAGWGNKGDGIGGSNSGARLDAANSSNKTPAKDIVENPVWDANSLAGVLSAVNVFRHKGGTGRTDSNTPLCSAGGGGADSVGGNVTTSNYGGNGGIGIVSGITGDDVYYGSGGGGGGMKSLMSRYPDNMYYDDPASVVNVWGSGRGHYNARGEDALPNQGGGGGGGGKAGDGGDGGSGIVVFRYTLKTEVKVDAAEYIESKLSDKYYTGLPQTSGLTEDEAYTVSEVGGTDAGEYEVVVTLKSGFAWADGDSSKSRTFTWNILKEPNNWKTQMELSVTNWAQHYAANVKFVQPVQTVGELNATITKDGVTEAFGGTLPVDPGVYTLKYWVEEDVLNYNGCSCEVTFTVYRSEAIDGGYKVFGLGENGNEEAMVFTQSGSWTLDKSLDNVQFLVVGGGGGGGADISTSNEFQAGSGGGGGGVVTGVANLVKGQTLAITVGQGGQGGVRGGSSPYGAVASQATDSSFAINGATTVTAYAGGGDAGSTSGSSETSGGQTGGAGGSSAGSRATATGRGEATRGAVVESDAIASYEKFGEQGGAGAAKYQSGGGGGATEEGSAGTSDNGGKGGEGLASDITGTMLVYGSGGGGGAVAGGAQGPGLGGTGAGNGGQYNEATSAAPNQGGGGGGGGRVGNGGNGGSGIVVFRYVVLKSPTIGDSPVDAAEAFEIAKVSKPVLYPSEPEVSTNTVDGVKVVTVAFGGVNAPVPDCYDVIKSVTDKGYQISLVIKDEFKNPSIANSADDKTPAIKIEDGKVKIHLEGTHGRLRYSLMTSTSLESSESWTTAKGDWSDNANFVFGDGDQKLDDARFFKVGEVSDEPIE